MASAPNLLMADWIKMFENEKTIPWSPAGIPIWSIFRKSGTDIDHRFSERVTGSGSRVRNQTMMAALSALAITVAHATPSTPIPNTATKSQSSSILHTVATRSE